MTTCEFRLVDVEHDIWAWMNSFLVHKSEFYGHKFSPCPFAQRALTEAKVDVAAWKCGDIRIFISEHARSMRVSTGITTRVIIMPPRFQNSWGLTNFVESLNAELIPKNLFLNTGVAKDTSSRYPGSLGKPYFIVVVNTLDVVLDGAKTLQRTDFYKNWPESHYETVVHRRSRMAAKFNIAA